MNDFCILFHIVIFREPNFAGLLAYRDVTSVKLLLNFGAKFIISYMKIRCCYGNVFFSEKPHVLSSE